MVDFTLFKESFGQEWSDIHQVVATCLVVQVTFGKHDSDEAKRAKVNDTRPLVNDVLSNGSCTLPANLGLVWNYMVDNE